MPFTEVGKMEEKHFGGGSEGKERREYKVLFCTCLGWILVIITLGPLLIKPSSIPVSNPFSKYLLSY